MRIYPTDPTVGCKNDKGHSSFEIQHKFAQKLSYWSASEISRQTSSWEKQDPLDFCLSFKDALMTLQNFRYTAEQLGYFRPTLFIFWTSHQLFYSSLSISITKAFPSM